MKARMKNRMSITAALIATAIVTMGVPSVSYASAHMAQPEITEQAKISDSSGTVKKVSEELASTEDGIETTRNYELPQATNNTGRHVRTLAASEETDNLTYRVADNVLTISGKGTMKDYGSSDAAPWSSYADSVKEVVIESGVTSIGTQAFVNFIALDKVTIADTVTEISDAAFYGNSSLQEVCFTGNSKLDSVGSGAFYDCSSLNKLELPDSVTSLGNYIIQKSGIISFTIPKNVKKMDVQKENVIQQQDYAQIVQMVII